MDSKEVVAASPSIFERVAFESEKTEGVKNAKCEGKTKFLTNSVQKKHLRRGRPSQTSSFPFANPKHIQKVATD